MKKTIKQYWDEVLFLEQFSEECQLLDENCLEDFLNSQYDRIQKEFERDYPEMEFDDLFYDYDSIIVEFGGI